MKAASFRGERKPHFPKCVRQNCKNCYFDGKTQRTRRFLWKSPRKWWSRRTEDPWEIGMCCLCSQQGKTMSPCPQTGNLVGCILTCKPGSWCGVCGLERWSYDDPHLGWKLHRPQRIAEIPTWERNARVLMSSWHGSSGVWITSVETSAQGCQGVHLPARVGDFLWCCFHKRRNGLFHKGSKAQSKVAG